MVRRGAHRACVIVVAVLASALAAVVNPARAATPPTVPAPGGRLVVSLAGVTPAVTDSVREAAVGAGGTFVRIDDVLEFAIVTTPPETQAAVTGALQGAPGVIGVRADVEVHALYTPDDLWYFNQWAPGAMGLPEAWEGGRGSHEPGGFTPGERVVAVIDSGIDYNHPDIAPNYCADGPNYVQPGSRPFDEHGHGTLVSGTLTARVDNTRDIAGVTNACLVAIKVLDASGTGYSSDVASAIVWAADHGVHVVNLSLGSSEPGGESYAVDYARSKGVIMVAGAGNSGCGGGSFFPAAYYGVIAVGALVDPTTRSSFSNCGSYLSLAAPGSNIRSTSMGGGMQVVSGTSIATPQVAGVAALLWDRARALSAAQIQCVLLDSADDIGSPGHDVQFGFGRIDADGGADRLTTPALPSWPNCAGNADPTAPRYDDGVYFGVSDAPLPTCPGIAAACLPVVAGETAVDLFIDDVFVEPAPGVYSFHGPGGAVLGSGALCGADNEIPVPAGATELRVHAGGPVTGLSECGAPVTATFGFVEARFNNA